MSDNRPKGRKFWTIEDVVDWIKTNVPDKDAPDGSAQAAIWWRCYRDTTAITDDTIRHIAQYLLGGTPPYTEETVTEHLQNWADGAGDTGHDAIQGEIDREIEADLREFFLGGR